VSLVQVFSWLAGARPVVRSALNDVHRVVEWMQCLMIALSGGSLHTSDVCKHFVCILKKRSPESFKRWNRVGWNVSGSRAVPRSSSEMSDDQQTRLILDTTRLIQE